MRCEECLLLLSDYIDKMLGEENSSQLEKHLAQCQKCADELAKMQAAVAATQKLPRLAAPSDLAARISNEISQRRRVQPRGKLVTIGTALAACLVLSFTLVPKLFVNPYDSQSIPTVADNKAPVESAQKTEVLAKKTEKERFFEEEKGKTQSHMAKNDKKTMPKMYKAKKPKKDEQQKSEQLTNMAQDTSKNNETKIVVKPTIVNTNTVGDKETDAIVMNAKPTKDAKASKMARRARDKMREDKQEHSGKKTTSGENGKGGKAGLAMKRFLKRQMEALFDTVEGRKQKATKEAENMDMAFAPEPEGADIASEDPSEGEATGDFNDDEAAGGVTGDSDEYLANADAADEIEAEEDIAEDAPEETVAALENKADNRPAATSAENSQRQETLFGVWKFNPKTDREIALEISKIVEKNQVNKKVIFKSTRDQIRLQVIAKDSKLHQRLNKIVGFKAVSIDYNTKKHKARVYSWNGKIDKKRWQMLQGELVRLAPGRNAKVKTAAKTNSKNEKKKAFKGVMIRGTDGKIQISIVLFDFSNK